MNSRHRLSTVLLILLVLLLCSQPSRAAVTLDDLFTRLAAHGFSGSVLITRHGETLLRKGYGLADRTTGSPVTADTVFSTGSITKQFTAAGILRLEMDGKLSTGDRLGTFLPAIAKSVGLDLAPDAVRGDLAAVTLHQLLSHTSGIDNYYLDQFPSWKEYLAEILKQPLTAPPGTAFSYSNSNYDLLGKIIEAVSGVSYERYLHDHLFVPAGLQSTGFDLPAWRRDRIARYQDWTTRNWPFPVAMPLDRPPGLRLCGSGEMLSTVDDLYKWHQALLGDRVLSVAAREKLFRPVLDSYAYGWYTGTTSRGTRVVFHGGFDTGLGTSAGFYRYLDDDVVLIFLANTNMNRQLNKEIVASWVEAVLFGGEVPLPPASLPAGPLPQAARYTLPSGAKLEVSAQGGQVVLATEDPAAMLLLTFPNVAAGDSLPEDEPVTRLFRGWWEQRKKDLGDVVSVRQLQMLTRDFEGEPEVQIFLLVRLARGEQLVRAIRGSAGRLSFNVEKVPQRLELILAPQGNDLYSAWSLRFQTAARIEITPGALIIHGRTASTIARRQEP
ncbi:MAG TPA: serine hydrolase domain-containing protein [Thermoanaerobaculia bacterium]|nr:serine hydrolase domain-containing protein [Thermoanaerobaculia bacterium]